MSSSCISSLSDSELLVKLVTFLVSILFLKERRGERVGGGKERGGWGVTGVRRLYERKREDVAERGVKQKGEGEGRWERDVEKNT